MVNFSIHVVGKVQGVFFRASTKTTADQLGITGFVRNEKDGSVYIEAEGEEEAMKKFISWCKTGPEMAIVEETNIIQETIKNFKGFEIRRA